MYLHIILHLLPMSQNYSSTIQRRIHRMRWRSFTTRTSTVLSAVSTKNPVTSNLDCFHTEENSARRQLELSSGRVSF
ncbi:unnamed protein product [Cylicostephanus goldi]|uniref:Uncharacterized protein n=1 Tax=Cylicostephanus goldi TaxID=71465 RepID=A0A3P6RBA9_CYLGO|nr:unnamed protein product [Cylicostephanus goldi]